MTFNSWFRKRIERSALGSGAKARPLGELEFAVIDVDLTGIDRDRDRVEGIAVLPLVEGRFRIADLRYCPLPCPGGEEPPEWRRDYEDLLEILAGRTVFTYNPRFVHWMLAKSAEQLGIPAPPAPWLDIAAAADVIGLDGVEATSMAHWLEKMRTGGRQEHDAVYDVFAMAQLLQAVLAYAGETGIETLEDLVRNQKAENWLRPY